MSNSDAPKPTDVLVNLVIDRSSSMGSAQSATIEGVNSFLADQRDLDGKCFVSMTQFDTVLDPIYVGVDVVEVPDLTFETYRPRGMTALYDAVGVTIQGTDLWLTNHPDFDGKVLCVIFTDGGENSSQQFCGAPGLRAINAMIEEKTGQGWIFQFMGAGVGWTTAQDFTSIPESHRHGYSGDVTTTSAAYKGLSGATVNLRSTSTYAGV